MENRWDVIIVGARCAGATLGALLAKQGVRTLILEASPRGTDMPMSTHLVQPPGMDVLDSIGVGDKVRAVTPASPRFRFALDEVIVNARSLEGRPPYCVRRSVIDPWLQDAAEQSGAELRDHHRVVELVREGERVTGVVARGPNGNVTLHADLVVGADGTHSTVAKLAGAEEYLVHEGTRAGYWGYFPAPSKWDANWDATLEHRGDELRYVFRTDSDLVTVVYVGEQKEVQSWGRDYRTKLMERFAASPTTAPLVEGKEQVGKTLGLLTMKFFYRRAVGPGFALVGDAGHFKDFVTGQGMADAFLDARRLSTAILDGRPEAYQRYWRERDVATLPLHFDAIRQGEVGFNEPFNRFLMSKLATRPRLLGRLALMLDRQISPADLIGNGTVLSWMALALATGRFDVLSGFLKAGPVLSAHGKELAERKALLAEAERELATAAPAAARSTERRAA
jgi:flavin-dependent dehydrogenase